MLNSTTKSLASFSRAGFSGGLKLIIAKAFSAEARVVVKTRFESLLERIIKLASSSEEDLSLC